MRDGVVLRVGGSVTLIAAFVGCGSAAGAEDDLRIGLVDSPVDTTVVSAGSCAVVTQAPAPVADTSHGTDVASLVVRGALPRCDAGLGTQVSVHPVEVVGGRVSAASFATAVHDALDEDVHLLHVGIVFDAPDPEVSAAIAAVVEAGVVVVAPAGNRPGLPAGWPARERGVIAVGATDADGTRADLSARLDVDAWAHGIDVPVPRPSGGLSQVSGTSFAAATFTSSVVALSAQMPVEEAASAALRQSTTEEGSP